ncbi:MAG TPA: FAD binding domain-containing protein [Ktedonobacterales bacterium]
MWRTFLRPGSLDELLGMLDERQGRARLVAGGTDVLVELSRGVLPTETLIDVTGVRELKYVADDGDVIRLGALATHNDVIASAACVERALPLAQACIEVGAPQIRTRATLAGNLVTASPANDTIAPLMALDADLVLASKADGERIVPLREFYRGVRKTVLHPGELLREIRVPALRGDQRGLFLKLGLRRAQAISVINVALVLTLDGDSDTVTQAAITLGCLAPTIVHARTAEAFLVGKTLDPATCAEAGRLACEDARPIDDLRGSAGYRLDTLAALVADGLRRLAEGRERDGWPADPILLETQIAAETASLLASPVAGGRLPEATVAPTNPSMSSPSALPSSVPSVPSVSSAVNPSASASSAVPPSPPFSGTIATTINGRPYTLEGAQGKTLLDALRENAGLTGTKEGCAEGECGACTVWLDGQAVMSCLVPAPQAHGAHITTIEGLATVSPSPHRERGSGGEDHSASSAVPHSSPTSVPSVSSAVDLSSSSPRPPRTSACSACSVPLPEGEAALHPLQRAFIEHGAVQCGFCIPGMLMAGAKLLDERPHPTLAQAQEALGGNICRCTGYRKILDAVLAAGSEAGSETETGGEA